MFRANIYSLEPLTPASRDAVYDGIGMVAANMGQSVKARELLVNLPVNERGVVNPLRVGFSKLDKMVELHLMAVPLNSGEDERIGLAGFGKGWSFVDISKDSEAVIRGTTGHEAAHAFGFVSPDAGHIDPESPGHCIDGSCIMHKTVKVVELISGEELEIIEAPRRLLGRFRSRRGAGIELPEATSSFSTPHQFDFCLSCKVDQRDSGEKRLAALRTSRLISAKSIR